MQSDSNAEFSFFENISRSVPKMRTVLVVDDEEGPRKSTRAVLKDTYRVLMAGDGNEALDHVAKENVDVAILDIRMPGMSGIELLERLKRADPRIECIMFTAYETVQSAIMALRRGAFDYLGKPFEVSHIRAVVANAMSHREMSDEIAAYPLQLRALIKEVRSLRSAGNGADNAFDGNGAPNDELVGQLLVDTSAAFIHKLINEFAEQSRIFEGIDDLLKKMNGSDRRRLRAFKGKMVSRLEATRYLLERFRNSVGRHPGVFRPLKLSKILRNVERHVRAQFKIRVSLILPRRIGEIMGDYELLWHLFENLIRNGLEAIHEVPGGGVTVSTVFDSHSQFIKVVVSDTGIGMNEKAIARIFDADYTTKPRGLGVGLYLVRRAAQIHGGQVECQSELGKGTTFTVSLPLARAARNVQA